MQQSELYTNIKTQLLEIKRTLNKLNNLQKEQPQLVPFNSVSFIETQVVQTEQVLICIGADYFIKTTNQKAQEILQRREQSKHINKKKKKVLKNIISVQLEQDQLEQMQNQLQETYDKQFEKVKDNNEDQPIPKSILKKQKEQAIPKEEKLMEKANVQDKKGKIIEIEGFKEIREEYFESQEEEKNEAQMIELYKELQIAFSNGNDEKYFQINQQIQLLQKQKQQEEFTQLEKQIELKVQVQNQEKHIKFKEEQQQPKKKISKFKQERLKQTDRS